MGVHNSSSNFAYIAFILVLTGFPSILLAYAKDVKTELLMVNVVSELLWIADYFSYVLISSAFLLHFSSPLRANVHLSGSYLKFHYIHNYAPIPGAIKVGAAELHFCLFGVNLMKLSVYTFLGECFERNTFFFQLFRHGDRTPVNPYPLDPYRNSSWWSTGWGQLTTVSSCYLTLCTVPFGCNCYVYKFIWGSPKLSPKLLMCQLVSGGNAAALWAWPMAKETIHIFVEEWLL